MMCILRNLVMKFPFNWSCSRHIRIFSLNMDWSIDVTKIHVNNISTDIMQKLNTSKWHSRSISISLFCGIITSTSLTRFVIRFVYFFSIRAAKAKFQKEIWYVDCYQGQIFSTNFVLNEIAVTISFSIKIR